MNSLTHKAFGGRALNWRFTRSSGQVLERAVERRLGKIRLGKPRGRLAQDPGGLAPLAPFAFQSLGPLLITPSSVPAADPAASRNSGENCLAAFCVMAPSSHRSEPPGNPGRFKRRCWRGKWWRSWFSLKGKRGFQGQIRDKLLTSAHPAAPQAASMQHAVTGGAERNP